MDAVRSLDGTDGVDSGLNPAIPAPRSAVLTPELATSTGLLLGRVGASVSRRISSSLAMLGVRQKHLAVLALLEKVGGCAQQTVAAALSLDPSGLVSVIDDLKRRGAVERERDPADRRRHTVRLTDQGRTLLEDCREAVRGVESEWLRVLGVEQRQQLVAILRQLAVADPAIPSQTRGE